MNFGATLKCLRERAGMTQAQLAQRSGVSQSFLSQIEREIRGIPSPLVLRRLAPALGTSYEDLLSAAGYLSLGNLTARDADAIRPSLPPGVQEFLDAELLGDGHYVKMAKELKDSGLPAAEILAIVRMWMAIKADCAKNLGR